MATGSVENATSAQTPLGLARRVGELLDHLGELVHGCVGLAVLTCRVASVDALKDDRQLPVGERDVEVDPGEVAAGEALIAVPDLLAGRKAGGGRRCGGQRPQLSLGRRPI